MIMTIKILNTSVSESVVVDVENLGSIGCPILAIRDIMDALADVIGFDTKTSFVGMFILVISISNKTSFSRGKPIPKLI